MPAEYESDITRFLRELKRERPELERRQKEARALWWDRPVDPEEQRTLAQSHVPQQAYVYQTDGAARRPRKPAA